MPNAVWTRSASRGFGHLFLSFSESVCMNRAQGKRGNAIEIWGRICSPLNGSPALRMRAGIGSPCCAECRKCCRNCRSTRRRSPCVTCWQCSPQCLHTPRLRIHTGSPAPLAEATIKFVTHLADHATATALQLANRKAPNHGLPRAPTRTGCTGNQSSHAPHRATDRSGCTGSPTTGVPECSA